MPEQPKVLVVDDEESVVVKIKAILQLDGYNVATTTSGATARAMVREVEYDLVLTDLRLEDGDGLDVLKAVRERYPETVTIMLTGYASLESAIQALRAGAYDYLVKPSETEQLEVVYRQTGKLARLVDELLDVSRIQTGRIEFRYGEVDMGELANEVATRMQLTTTTHQISVRRDSQNVVTADRDHLEQVLNNLVTNAIKYSPSGGHITIDVRPDDGGVRLSVTDQGIGIPEKELEAIFGLFYRSPDRAAPDAAGMGLGLYIRKEIVLRHGGRILAEGGRGEGSTPNGV